MERMNMKKTIAILLVLAVVLTGAFATDANVKLNANVATVNYTAALFYDNDALANGNGIFSDGVGGSAKWDLSSTSPVATETFAVKVTGNENAAKSLKVTVSAANFMATVGGVSYDSEVAVTATAVTGNLAGSANTISAGKHTDEVLCSWTLGWTGNAGLPAADYTSDVTIGYVVE
jgi:hypothetical protein